MAIPIKLKRSSVAGKRPTAANLNLGELGINTTDGKVYLKQSGSNEIFPFFIIGADNSGSVVLEGDFTITGSIIITGVVDGVDISGFSSSVATEIDVLQATSASFSSRAFLLESTASNHESRIVTLESSPSGLWTSSDSYINRESDVKITGSLYVSSNISVGGTVDGVDIFSFSSSASSEINNLQSDSASFSTRIDNLVIDSSSFSSRTALLELTANDHESRISSVEGSLAASGSLWTSSDGYVNRASDVKITGSLYVSSNISVGGTVDGVDISNFSSSVSTEINNLQVDSSSFATRIDNLTTNSSSFSNRTALLELTASDHESRIGTLETSPSGLWTSSDGYINRQSDVKISGSLYISSSIVINGTVDGVDISSFSSSASTEINSLQADSASLSLRIDNLVIDSSSFSDRTTLLESTASDHESRISSVESSLAASGSLWTASDGYVNRASDVKITGSLYVSSNILVNGTVDGVDVAGFSSSVSNEINNLQSDSSSFATRIDGLVADSSSFSTRTSLLESTASDHEGRIITLESSPVGLWTSSDGYINRQSDVKITGSLSISTNVIVDGDVSASNSGSFRYLEIRGTEIEAPNLTINQTASINTLIATEDAIFKNDVSIGIDSSSLSNPLRITHAGGNIKTVILRKYNVLSSTSPAIQFITSRGSIGAASSNFANDEIGEIEFRGHNGSSDVSAANILINADTNAGSAGLPSRIQIRVIPTGSASGYKTALVINSNLQITASDAFQAARISLSGSGLEIDHFSNDSTFSGSSAAALSTQAAIKTYIQNISSSIASDVDNLQIDSSSFSARIVLLESTASDHESRIDSLESTVAASGSLWTSSDGYINRQSNVHITGSIKALGDADFRSNLTAQTTLDVIQESVVTGNALRLQVFSNNSNLLYAITNNIPVFNINGAGYTGIRKVTPAEALDISGSAVISENLKVTGSIIVGGTVDSVDIFGFSSSVSTEINSLQADSSSFATRIDNLVIDSASFSSEINSLQLDSASFSGRVTLLESTASNHEGRIITLESSPGGLWTSSIGYISRESDVKITGSAYISGSLEIINSSGVIFNIYRNNSVVTMSSIVLSQGAAITEISTDTGLSDNSNTAVPTERAVKTYVDAQVIAAASGSVFGSGSSGYLARWASSASLTSSQLFENSLGVSVFGTNPQSEFHVIGDISASNLNLAFSATMSSLLIGGTDYSNTSASFQNRITTNTTDISVLQLDSSSFASDINSLQADSASVSSRVTLLESTASNHESRIITLESSPSGLWTSSDGYISRQSNVKISGSLYVSSSIVVNGTVDGVDISGFSSSVSTEINSLQADSSSFATRIDNLITDSASFSGRVSLLESTASDHESRIITLETASSGLWTSSDGYINRQSDVKITGSLYVSSSIIVNGLVDGVDISAFSGSVATKINNLQIDSSSLATRIDSLVTDSASFSNRTSLLESTASNHEGRIITLESSPSGLWTASDGYVNRESDVKITGSLYVSSNISVGGTVDSVDIFNFSSSVSNEINNLQADSSSFATRIDSLVTDSSSFSTRTSLLESTASDHEGRIISLESSPSGLWTSSDGYINRQSDVKITGSLYVSSSIIVNGLVDGVNISTFSSSVLTKINNLQTDSASFATDIVNLQADSASFSTRTALLELTASNHEGRIDSLEASVAASGSLWTASDGYINRASDVKITGSLYVSSNILVNGTVDGVGISGFSSSVSTEINALQVDSSSFASRIDNLTTDSSSFSSRVSLLESTASNHEGRIATLETSPSGLWTSSNGYINRESDVKITGSLYVSSNILVGGTVDGVDIFGFSGSAASEINSLQSDSASFSTRIDNLVIDSSSFSSRTALLELTASNHEGRIITLETAPSGLWTSSDGYINRQSDVKITGSLYISSNIIVGGTVDGVNISAFSGSVSTEINNLQTDSSSFATRIDNLILDSSSFSTRTSLLESTASNHEGRIITLETSPSGLWTSSNGYINRESDVKITGSLHVSSNISVGGTVDGVDILGFSSSVASEIDILQADSSSFATRIDNLIIDSSSFSGRATLLEATASDHESRITTLEASPFGLWTSSNGYINRESDVKITGSLYVNSNILVGGTVDGVDIFGFSSSVSTEINNLQADSSSFATRIDNLVSNSASFASNISNLILDSASFSTRTTLLELTGSNHEGRIDSLESAAAASGSLWTASDGYINRVSDVKITGSLHVTTDILMGGTIDGVFLAEFSSSVATEINNLQSDSASFSTRVTTLESNPSSFWTGSGTYINRASDVKITGSLDVSGNITGTVVTASYAATASKLNHRIRIGHTYAIPGVIAPATGTENYIIPFILDFPTYQRGFLSEARYFIQTGSEVNVSILTSGNPAAGFSNISVTTASQGVAPTPIELFGGNTLALVVNSVTHSSVQCQNLSFNIYMDYEI